MNLPIGKSASDWDPGAGKGKSDNAKLMSTTARDAKDTLAPDNKLEQYIGAKGTPTGPMGLKGRSF